MYTDQRFLSSLMRVRRDVRLPENAVGNFTVAEGQAVEIRNKVGRAIIPNKHLLINAAAELGLRDVNALSNMLLVRRNQVVSHGTAIAGKDAKRGKRVFAPVDGLVVDVLGGRIVFQARPQVLELEAGVRGMVTEITANRVTIETVGALLQGVWGNGTTVIATMRMEPASGIDSLPRDVLDTTYKNEIIISTRPLTLASFEVLEVRGLAGIVAPSMDSRLEALALQTERAIVLTEGFGDARLSSGTLDWLKEFDTYQVTMNASLPSRWDVQRPELVVNRLGNEESNRAVSLYETVRRGARVRVTREPYAGAVGKVVAVSRSPQPIANGLRVMAVIVDLTTGAQITVPLASIELI